MKQTKKPWTKKRKMIYVMQYTTLLSLILYFAWLIIDCVFISKGLHGRIDPPYIDWSEAWYNASKILAIIFISSGGLVIVCNLGYLIHRAFNFKADTEKNVYGIIINSLIIIAGLISIICTADYIKNDTIVCTWEYDWSLDMYIASKLTHIDFLNFISSLFIICCFSMLMTWEKRENFGVEFIEQDIKSTIRIFGLASILFYPFMVWLVQPISLLTSTNNLIGQVMTAPMGMCFAMTFIGLFVEFLLQIYKKTKLFVSNNLVHIILYGSLFFVLFVLFVVSHSFTFDIWKLDQSWKSTIGLCTPQLALCLFAVFFTIFDKRLQPKAKQESIYE